jgi:hypothetical protein
MRRAEQISSRGGSTADSTSRAEQRRFEQIRGDASRCEQSRGKGGSTANKRPVEARLGRDAKLGSPNTINSPSGQSGLLCRHTSSPLSHCCSCCRAVVLSCCRAVVLNGAFCLAVLLLPVLLSCYRSVVVVVSQCLWCMWCSWRGIFRVSDPTTALSHYTCTTSIHY